MRISGVLKDSALLLLTRFCASDWPCARMLVPCGGIWDSCFPQSTPNDPWECPTEVFYIFHCVESVIIEMMSIIKVLFYCPTWRVWCTWNSVLISVVCFSKSHDRYFWTIEKLCEDMRCASNDFIHSHRWMRTSKRFRENSVRAYVEKTHVVVCFHREFIAVWFWMTSRLNARPFHFHTCRKLKLPSLSTEVF